MLEFCHHVIYECECKINKHYCIEKYFLTLQLPICQDMIYEILLNYIATTLRYEDYIFGKLKNIKLPIQKYTLDDLDYHSKLTLWNNQNQLKTLGFDVNTNDGIINIKNNDFPNQQFEISIVRIYGQTGPDKHHYDKTMYNNPNIKPNTIKPRKRRYAKQKYLYQNKPF